MKTLLFVTCLALHGLQAEPTLTNAGIVELVRAGFTDDTLVRLIDSRDTAFDVSVKGLLELKQAGLSNRLIRAILAIATRDEPAASQETLPPLLPDEQGVYLVADRGLQRLPVEIVTLRGGARHDETGAVRLPRSMMRVTPPLTFLVRTSENVTANEYLLLQLLARKERREFRTLVGSLWRPDGADRMMVPFESRRVAPNVYRLQVVALPRGEFGFLRPGEPLGPPGVVLGQTGSGTPNLTFAGTLYTFGVN